MQTPGYSTYYRQVNIELEPSDKEGASNGEYQLALDITDAIDGDPIERVK